MDYLRKNIVKKGDEYVRVRYSCCGICKIDDEQNVKNNKNNDEMKLSTMELDDEISSSMYSSQASTVVNNNLKKEQLINQFNDDSDDESVCSSDGPETPKNLSFNSSNDVVDHPDLLTNSTISTKTFVIDPSFDQNISATSPSSFTTFKDLRNNSATSLNRNSLIIERDTSDLSSKFDVISLDDQSLSSNSSYDVLHAANRQQANAQQSSTPTNQTTSILNQNGYNSSPNQQPQLSTNQSNQQLNKPNNVSSNELLRKDSFSCGSPPQLISTVLNNNCCEIADEDTRHHCCDDEDLLSSSGESNTLAEDAVDTGDLRSTTNSNIQRSNAVAIPSRNNRQSTNAYNGSNNSNLSNTSNRLSDQSFNLNRCDSWQIVTGTGSVKDKNFLSSNSLDEIKRNVNLKLNGSASSTNHFSSSSSNYHKFRQQNHHNTQNNYVPTCCCKSLNCGKYCEKVEKFNKENDLEKFIYTRKKRLSDVRVVFYQCYSRYIGLSTANGASGSEITTKFSNLFNKTCEKIKYPFRAGGLNGNGFTRNGNTRLSNRKASQSFQSYILDADLNDKNENSNDNQ